MAGLTTDSAAPDAEAGHTIHLKRRTRATTDGSHFMSTKKVGDLSARAVAGLTTALSSKKVEDLSARAVAGLTTALSSKKVGAGHTFPNSPKAVADDATPAKHI